MCVLMAMVLVLSPEDPILDWVTISPEKGGFSVRLPPNSSVTRRKAETDGGTAEIVVVQSVLGKTAYLVTYTDVSPKSARAPRSLLDGTRDLVVKSSKGRLISEKRIVLEKNSGREIRAEVPIGEDARGGILDCRIYLVGRRVYQVMTIAPVDESGSGSIDAFFRSFRLTTPR